MTTADLPPLAGSPKQIAWAEDIRAQALVEIDKFRAGMAAHVAQHPETAVEEAANNAALDQVIAAHTDARWWIDHRHRNLAEYQVRVEANEIVQKGQGK